MNYYLHKKEESMVMMRPAIHIYIGGLKPAMMCHDGDATH